MITDDRQLRIAQQAVRNLESILEKARKTHSSSQYKAMSKPVLLELQRRENEIIQYLSFSEDHAAAM